MSREEATNRAQAEIKLVGYGADLRELLKIFGLPCHERGQCYGFGHMALFAGLSRQFPQFYARLEILHRVVTTIREEIETGVISTSAKYLDLKNRAVEILSEIYQEERYQDIFRAFPRKLESEVEIFLSLVSAIQNSAEKEFEGIFRPHGVKYVSQAGIGSFLHDFAPVSINSQFQSYPAVVDSYDRTELAQFFQKIADRVDAFIPPATQPVGMVMFAKEHVITVIYDPHSKQWALSEINLGGGFDKLNAELLSEEVFECF